MERRHPSAFVAEFIGTTMLVLFVGLILSVFNSTPEGIGFQDFTSIALMHVFILALLVAAFGGVSGAHFNPAVTVALALLRRIRPSDAAVYVVGQIAGAVAGALIVRAVLSDEGAAVDYGAVGIDQRTLDGDWLPALVLEAIGTFALMLAIMAVAVNPRTPKTWAPFVIGGTLGAIVLAIGPLTGGGFNPARALGPAVVGDAFYGAGDFVMAYVIGPVIGAALAGVVYTATALRPRTLEAQAPIETLPS